MACLVPLLLLAARHAPTAATPVSAARVVVVKSADAAVVTEISTGFRSAFPGMSSEEVLLDDKNEGALASRLAGAEAVLSVGARAAGAVAKAKPAAATSIACLPAGQVDVKTFGPTLRLE